MKQFFHSAAGIGLALAVLAISLSVAAAALGARWRPGQEPVYIGQQFEKEQRALQSQPVAAPAPAF